MSIASLTQSELAKITTLFRKKERLIAKKARVDSELESVIAKIESFAEKSNSVRKPGFTRRSRRHKRGAISGQILEILEKTGSQGVHVGEISQILGVKKANVTSWFYGAGKGKTKKIAPATFALAKGT